MDEGAGERTGSEERETQQELEGGRLLEDLRRAGSGWSQGKGEEGLGWETAARSEWESRKAERKAGVDGVGLEAEVTRLRERVRELEQEIKGGGDKFSSLGSRLGSLDSDGRKRSGLAGEEVEEHVKQVSEVMRGEGKEASFLLSYASATRFPVLT
eukprot:1276557-Rhodomonas_salina.1